MTSLFLSLIALLTSCMGTSNTAEQQIDPKNLPDGLYAEFTTNKGTIITTLEYQKTPLTVANFVSLAEGTNEFVDAKYKGKKFYDGLTWHRVIKDLSLIHI